MSKVDIEKKVKKKKYGIILIILILIISVFFVLLTQTSFFDVKRDNIILKNSKTLDRDKIIMASGLGLNENIFIIVPISQSSSFSVQSLMAHQI